MSQTLLKHNESEQANATKHKWGSVLGNVDIESETPINDYEKEVDALEMESDTLMRDVSLGYKNPGGKKNELRIEQMDYIKGKTGDELIKALKYFNKQLKKVIKYNSIEITAKPKVSDSNLKKSSRGEIEFSEPYLKPTPKKKVEKKEYTKEELAEQARKVDAQWADEKETPKTKTSKTSKTSKKEKETVKQEVVVQVPAKVKKVDKTECEILIDTTQTFVKNLDSKKFNELIKMKDELTIKWSSLSESEKAILKIPNERINGKIHGFIKKGCVSVDKIIEDTLKKEGTSNGKKFESYLINKTLQTINNESGLEVLYDRRGIINNVDNPSLQVQAHGYSYSLAEASLYDFSTPTHDIEVKYYTEINSLDDVAIPLEKFFGNKHFTPYFRVVNGEVKLFNVWCDEINDWVNKENDKEVLFVIMTSKGIVTYNYTDDLTRSLNSTWRKTPFDIRLNELNRVDREGNLLLAVYNYTYKPVVRNFGKGNKDCCFLPEDKLKYCYIKK